ncbi:MAG: penicillin-binding transpeptidase domain-containing protein [Oscillospiraceae bacterium]
MKSLRRGSILIGLIIAAFVIGMIALFAKIQLEASYYIINSNESTLGIVYDKDGDVLFDEKINYSKYPDYQFADVGNFIGDSSGQMTNTIVSRNSEILNNYTFSGGVNSQEGKSAIYTTLDHAANRKVFNAFGSKEGCAIAYNYKTGEILVCVSLPCVNPMKGYDNLPSGSLLCKNFIKTVPGSTQKIATLVSAFETMGYNKLYSKSYECTGSYLNHENLNINCHNKYGHGVQNISEAFANSCNPFFAQLVEDKDLSLESIKRCYTRMGYAVNGSTENEFEIDGIRSETASTTLTNTDEFNTQWSCIGQGESMVSPCQLMMWQSAIANETGKATIPYFISSATNVKGRVVKEGSTKYTTTLFSAQTASYVKEIMVENGTNNYKNTVGFNLGVKSGTAQVKHGDEENSLLTGFCTDEDFPIAFCIVIENRVSGEVSTEHIASVMLSALYNNM